LIQFQLSEASSTFETNYPEPNIILNISGTENRSPETSLKLRKSPSYTCVLPYRQIEMGQKRQVCGWKNCWQHIYLRRVNNTFLNP